MEISTLSAAICEHAQSLGFNRVGFSGITLSADEQHLLNWLDNNYHGEMHYMAAHGSRRSRPAELVKNTLCVISVSMDYLPANAADPWTILTDPCRAYIARYALGRDYHKMIRKRLQHLADYIQSLIGDFGYRAFADSAPVLERALGRNAGLGWIGKHANLLHQKSGSWFFLGELYTDLPLPTSTPVTDSCGDCRRCIDICPTQAIVAPYQLDARRCISYLTIELKGSIPEDLRALIGNRIFGCDDCQLVCPWNRFAKPSTHPDFAVRHKLDACNLLTLFTWSESEFDTNTQGSAIRRIGYERWLRNLAVALGNALQHAINVWRNDADNQAAKTVIAIHDGLKARAEFPSPLVREHVHWALSRIP